MALISKKARTRIFALVIGCFVALLLIELGLRIHNPIFSSARGGSIVLPYNKRFEGSGSVSAKIDDRVFCTFNSGGFRGPEAPSDFDGQLTFFTIGGSTTQCRLITDGKTWPALLAKRLGEELEGVWLNNAGMEGHSTFGHLVLMEEHLLAKKPDYLIFLVGLNDISRGDLSDWDKQLDPSQLGLKNKIIAKSELLSTLQVVSRTMRAHTLGLSHYPELDLATAATLEMSEAEVNALMDEHRSRHVPSFEERLRRIVSLCRENGIEPVFVTQPALYGEGVDPATGVEIGPLEFKGENAATRWEVMELYNDVTRKVALESDLCCVDLARELPKDSALFYDWVHYSNEGAAAIAEIVAENMIPYLRERGHTER